MRRQQHLARVVLALPVQPFDFPMLPCVWPADEPERAKWYSQTQFADVWRRLTEQNPFYTPRELGGKLNLHSAIWLLPANDRVACAAWPL